MALCWSAHAQGLIASARTGGVFDGVEKRPGVWHFAERSRPPRFVLNQGGAGGHDYSIKWPDKLAVVPLRYVVVKTVLNPDSYKDPNEPIRAVDELRGRIHNIQARRLDGPATPANTSAAFRPRSLPISDRPRSRARRQSWRFTPSGRPCSWPPPPGPTVRFRRDISVSFCVP